MGHEIRAVPSQSGIGASHFNVAVFVFAKTSKDLLSPNKLNLTILSPNCFSHLVPLMATLASGTTCFKPYVLYLLHCFVP